MCGSHTQMQRKCFLKKQGMEGVWELRSGIPLSPRPLRWHKYNQILYTTIKAVKGVCELASRTRFTNAFPQRWKIPLRKLLGSHTGMSQEPFGYGVVRFSLTEFTWLVSCSIVTDHYSFQYLKAILFRCLHAVGVVGQAWLLKLSIC